MQVLRSLARMEIKPGRDWLVLWVEASGPLLKTMNLKLISQVGGTSPAESVAGARQQHRDDGSG